VLLGHFRVDRGDFEADGINPQNSWPASKLPHLAGVAAVTQAERRAWIAAGKPPLVSEPEPKPQPAQPVTMDDASSRAWNDWGSWLIHKNVDAFAEAIGTELNTIHERIFVRIIQLETELGELRAERAAKVIDLPNWRQKNAA
jgi:hypothetical protein